MPAARPQQTQDIIDRLAAIFQPQLKDIKDQLNNLVTRREHEKDLTEVNDDITSQKRDIERLQDWADKRPRESADMERVRRIEADVQEINTRIAKQPAEARAWFDTFTNSGGCLVMALLAIVAMGVNTAISLIVAVVVPLIFHP